jgi:hypothetical protein
MTNSHLPSEEIPRPLVYYCVHSSPPLIPHQTQMSPVHTAPPYHPKIHSYIIFSRTPSSSEWSLSFRVSDHNFVLN